MERFINSGTTLAEQSFKLRNMRCKGIHVNYVGTNQSGQTLAVANLGTLDCTIKGRPDIHASVAQLALINDYDYGENLRASATSGAFDINIYIPFRNEVNPLDSNAVDISEDDYITIPAVSSTVVASWTVAVYIDECSDTPMYDPTIFTRSQVITAQSPVFLPDKNLYRLLITEPTTPPTKILLNKNGKMILDVPYTVAENITKREGRLEPTSTFNACVLQFGNVYGVRGQNYELQMVGGADTGNVYTAFAIKYLHDQTTIDAAGNVVRIDVAPSAGVMRAGGGVAQVPGVQVSPHPRSVAPPNVMTD